MRRNIEIMMVFCAAVLVLGAGLIVGLLADGFTFLNDKLADVEMEMIEELKKL